MLSKWHGEYEWDNFTVKFHTHRGQKTGVVIEYGKNLTDLEQDEDNSGVYTALLPYAVQKRKVGHDHRRRRQGDLYGHGDIMKATGQYTVVNLCDVTASDTPPEEPYTGQLWVDTTESPPETKVWNGSEWLPENDLETLRKTVETTTTKCAEGATVRKWTPAPNEIYTEEVKIDRRGIEVSNTKSSQRTVITNAEFSGYYNEEKIFTLNKDETRTKKTTVDGELTVGKVKFVPAPPASRGLNIVVLD